MTKHKRLSNFSFEKHQIYGLKLQLCENFLTHLQCDVSEAYGLKSIEYKNLETIRNKLEELTQDLDSRVFQEDSQRRDTKELSHCYRAGSRAYNPWAWFLLSTDDKKANEK